MASTKATELVYTEKELEAIEILKAHRGEALSAKELGISNGTMTSLIKKANDERPMAAGFERAVIVKEDFNAVCPTCGAKISHKVYKLAD